MKKIELKGFRVDDCIHAKPQAKFLKQNIMRIISVARKNCIVEDILTHKKYSFSIEAINTFFEKTYCYIPPKHPITNLFK